MSWWAQVPVWLSVSLCGSATLEHDMGRGSHEVGTPPQNHVAPSAVVSVHTQEQFSKGLHCPTSAVPTTSPVDGSARMQTSGLRSQPPAKSSGASKSMAKRVDLVDVNIGFRPGR